MPLSRSHVKHKTWEGSSRDSGGAVICEASFGSAQQSLAGHQLQGERGNEASEPDSQATDVKQRYVRCLLDRPYSDALLHFTDASRTLGSSPQDVS